MLFETLADIDLSIASCIADDIYSNIIKDCYIIFDGMPIREKSEFFELVKKYIDKHPVDFKENHTKVEFYAGNIILENLEMIYREFKERYKGKILMRIDYPVAIDFFEKMEYFNNILVDAFVFAPIGLSISQHFVIRSMGMLLYRDP